MSGRMRVAYQLMPVNRLKQQDENQVRQDGLPRRKGPDHEPENISGQQALQSRNGPKRDIPVQGQDAQAVKERPHAVVIRQLVQK